MNACRRRIFTEVLTLSTLTGEALRFGEPARVLSVGQYLHFNTLRNLTRASFVNMYRLDVGADSDIKSTVFRRDGVPCWDRATPTSNPHLGP